MGWLRWNPIVSRGASVFFPVLFFSSPQSSPPKVELDTWLCGSLLKPQRNVGSKRITLTGHTRMQSERCRKQLPVKLAVRTLKYSHWFENEAGGDRHGGLSSPPPTCSWPSWAEDSPPCYRSVNRVPSRLLTVSSLVWPTRKSDHHLNVIFSSSRCLKLFPFAAYLCRKKSWLTLLL